MTAHQETERIVHPLKPVFDKRSQVLVLGTMPSPASRELGFYYGHPQNRFWRVMAHLFGEPAPSTNKARADMMLRHHIALWDVLESCVISGASDASIREAVPNDLAHIVKESQVNAVFCTGAKSFELFTRFFGDTLGVPCYRLPSTSPANAAASFDTLVAAYDAILPHLDMPVPVTLDVSNVVRLEQEIAARGTSLYELMDRAGTWLAQHVHDGYSEANALVVCGNGNNGGDGWVAARELARAGHRVTLVTPKSPSDLTAQPAGRTAVEIYPQLVEMGVDVEATTDPYAVGYLLEAMPGCVVVDAMLGTGFDGETVKEPYAGWIDDMNAHREHGGRTVAADVPSGYSAQTGRAADHCVKADSTVTMICRKPGLDAENAPAICGDVHVAPLAYIEPLLKELFSAQ